MPKPAPTSIRALEREEFPDWHSEPINKRCVRPPETPPQSPPPLQYALVALLTTHIKRVNKTT